VLPIFAGNEVIGVLDVDSGELAHFDDIDSQYLNKIISLIYG
jgi:L-methionine (R)-S-oxide reductase